MIAEGGFYYLHTNGDLIWKQFRPEYDSDFVKRVWVVDAADRGCAWIIAVEALALGANKTRIDELAHKWGLTDEDAQEFANRAKLQVFKDGNKWCATFADFINLQESQAGFGSTAIEALAELAKQGLIRS
jgi:hypothetical protein